VGLDSAFGAGASAVVIGALAVLLGRMPGGVLSSLGRWWRAPGGAVPAPAVQLSPAGQAVAARIRR
jgi:branched-chain amino acid transport system permease protein